jgi:hypothetical protein
LAVTGLLSLVDGGVATGKNERLSTDELFDA